MNSLENSHLESIIKGCKAYDLKSQAALYEFFYAYAMSVCLRYTANEEDALEILNDSFLKVFKKIKQQNKEASFKPWLRKILINTAIDYHRKFKKIDFEQGYNSVVVETHSSSENILDQLAADEIIGIIKGLATPYRLVFNLYVIEGYSHKEIAQKLKITPSTSRAHLSVANARLRSILSKKNNEKKFTY